MRRVVSSKRGLKFIALLRQIARTSWRKRVETKAASSYMATHPGTERTRRSAIRLKNRSTAVRGVRYYRYYYYYSITADDARALKITRPSRIFTVFDINIGRRTRGHRCYYYYYYYYRRWCIVPVLKTRTHALAYVRDLYASFSIHIPRPTGDDLCGPPTHPSAPNTLSRTAVVLRNTRAFIYDSPTAAAGARASLACIVRV